MWIVYHATSSPNDGWANRKARVQLLELRGGIPYAGLHPLQPGDCPAPSGSFIPADTTPLPETVLGPLPNWGNDLDMKQFKEKAKKFWSNVKRKISKPEQSGR